MQENQEQRGLAPENGGNTPEEEYLSTGQLFWEMGKILLLAVVIIIPIRVFFFQPFFVQGSSMEPNFQDGEYLVISEFGYKYTDIPFPKKDIQIEPWNNLGRQEIVVFRYPRDPSQFYIKRVIGLPGETVAIKNGQVMIGNAVHPEGFVLDESGYLDPAIKTSDMPPLVLGSDEYFMMGDNRAFSYDSRFFGPVKREAVIGRVLVRAWPLSRVGIY